MLSSVRALRAMDESELLDRALERAAQFLAYGTTMIEAKSGYGLDLESELKILRVIKRLGEQSPLDVVPTFLGAHEIPPEFRNDREGYLKLICERMIPAVADEGLAEFCDVFCESHVFSVDESRRVLEAGARHGLAPKIHADQLARTGGTRLACEIGAVSVDHADYADEEDIAALADGKTIATLLPGCVFHLGLTHQPPARAMIDAGAAVALATDFNPGSAPSLSIPMTLALACNNLRMTPAEALAAATINGAFAMRRADRAGSIEPGKQADLVVLALEDERLIPYHFGMRPVRMTIKNGEIV
ncbi:MAG: imidazolonepropionase [Deltaproteobacteria bacterium]|nr:imidazolonepropionase [Deltaproteobacteria bacterium]